MVNIWWELGAIVGNLHWEKKLAAEIFESDKMWCGCHETQEVQLYNSALDIGFWVRVREQPF